MKMRWTETCEHFRLVSQTDGENHFSGLKSAFFKIQSFTSLLPGLRAVLAVLTLLPGAGVHVLQRVRPLYGQFGRVHHGQGALVRVQPGLVPRGVILLPRRVFLTRLVDTLHHLEGVSRDQRSFSHLGSQWRTANISSAASQNWTFLSN